MAELRKVEHKTKGKRVFLCSFEREYLLYFAEFNTFSDGSQHVVGHARQSLQRVLCYLDGMAMTDVKALSNILIRRTLQQHRQGRLLLQIQFQPHAQRSVHCTSWSGYYVTVTMS